MGRGDLTDEQWATLEPLLPKGAKAGRPPVWPRRRLIDGIRFRVRTGVPWRDVPVEYGPWGRVYDLFHRWQRDGTWHRILTRLQSLADAKGATTWDLDVDSTVCRAHQHCAAGVRKQGAQQKEPPGGVFTEPGDHGLGRSRGGFTTQLQLAVEQGPKPMSILVTAGQRGDSPQFEPVLEKVGVPRIGPGRPRVRPNRVRADKAYASRKNRAYLRRRGIRAPSPTRLTRRTTGESSAPAVAGHRASPRSTIASVVRWSAGSTASRAAGPASPAGLLPLTDSTSGQDQDGVRTASGHRRRGPGRSPRQRPPRRPPRRRRDPPPGRTPRRSRSHGRARGPDPVAVTASAAQNGTN